jgi:hypothetical protein
VLQNDYPILAESKQAHAPRSQDNIMFVMYLNDGNIKYTYIQRLLCEISSSHGGEYDVQSCLLGYTAM